MPLKAAPCGKYNATRATSQQAAKAASAAPRVGGCPVQVATAVSRKPTTTAPA